VALPKVTGPDCAVPAEPAALFPPPTWTVPVDVEALLPPPPPTAAGSETENTPSGVVPPAVGATAGPADCAVPVESVALLPPPTWMVPVDVEASLVPAPPTEAGAVAVIPSTFAVTPTFGAPAWMVPSDAEALLPPPACTVPVASFAELPVPAIPATALTPAVCPPDATVAAGAAWIPLTCAVPVEPEA